MRSRLALLLVLGLGSAALASASTGEAPGAGEVVAAFDAQLEAIAQTDELLAQKYQTHAHELERRMRAAYKIMRSGWAPLWVDPERRTAMAQRRALVERALARTVRELSLLRGDITAAARARSYLQDAREAAASAALPAPASLHRPVAPGTMVQPFGIHALPGGVRLTRRGVELAGAAGAPVQAVAAGVVRHAGPVRGLGYAVIVAHDGFVSVLARLGEVTTRRGARVGRGDALGVALGDRVYLEIRLDVGGGGYPVDPSPLLE
jgi:septal ring factor EnvC (AmiA/AmiB activator)